MIRACVFDLGGVVFDFSFEPFYRQVLPHCRPGTTRAELEHLVELRHAKLERGQESFEDYFDRYRREVGLQMEREEFEQAWDDIFSEKPDTIALLRRIRSARRLMLSNTDESHIAWVKRRFPEPMGLFERHFFSYELGEIKPLPGAFRAVEQWSRLAPAEHVLIDDLEGNVHAARENGWQAITFIGAVTLARVLASLGVELAD